jgi:hypothetical protein
MVKIATPILFESPLDELNRVRPLKLSEKSRFSLDLPVLSKNPVGTGQPIIGKFARCDDNGALLNNKVNSIKQYEVYEKVIGWSGYVASVTFSKKVSCVLVEIIEANSLSYLAWCQWNYSNLYKQMVSEGVYFLPFKGEHIYFLGEGEEYWVCYFNVYGFY